MTNETSVPRSYARIAGLLYLVIIICGIGGEAFVRAPMLADDAGQTVANLVAAELPFRLSILADVAMLLADVALGILLYVLLAPVDRTLSLAAMGFRLAQASVLGANLVNLDRAMTLAQGPAFGDGTRDALVTSFLQAHAAGYDLGLFFFAVNCVLVGVLVVRSSFLPRALGWGIGAAGVVYLVGSTLRFAAPELADVVAPAYGLPFIAELALAGWLVVRGLDLPSWHAAASSDLRPAAAGC